MLRVRLMWNVEEEGRKEKKTVDVFSGFKTSQEIRASGPTPCVTYYPLGYCSAQFASYIKTKCYKLKIYIPCSNVHHVTTIISTFSPSVS